MLQPSYNRHRFCGILLGFLAVLLASTPSVNAAGNEEVILIENVGVTAFDTMEDITYSCTYRNLWTAERQPVNFPPSARWAGPIAFTSTLQFQPWKAASAVTRGVEKLAEEGFTDALIQEMEQQGEQVLEWAENPRSYLTVGSDYYVHLPPLKASFGYPYLTMIAGMSPSPDWFTGFYALWLVDEYSRTWYDHVKIQVYPWDAGTDAGSTYDSEDSDLDPPVEIQRFTPRNAPEGGELRGADGMTVPVVGEFECMLTVGPDPLVLPDCDWFLNPCCNETDTEACGKELPNGAVPETSPEVAEMLQSRTVVTIEGYLQFGFFDDDLTPTIVGPTPGDIDAIMQQMTRFYDETMRTAYPDVTLVDLEFVSSALQEGEYVFINFDATFNFEKGETAPSGVDVFSAMEEQDYQNFITNYAWQATGFSNVNAVMFNARTGGGDGSSETDSPAPTISQSPTISPGPTVGGDDGGCGPKTLTFDEGLVVSYTIGLDARSGLETFSVTVVHEGQGWIGFGISPTGSMLGSNAVIGLTDEPAGDSNPGKYFLGDYAVRSVELSDNQSLVGKSLSQNDTHTVLSFTKLLEEPNEVTINKNGENFFVVAVGSSGDLGYHATRHAFTENIVCPEVPGGSVPSPPPTVSQSTTISPTVRNGGEGGAGGGGNTVLDVIRSNPELSDFSIALELTGLDRVLGDGMRQFTVFAPSNQAIENDPVFSTYMNSDGWVRHLHTNIEFMIVLDVALMDADIFDRETTELASLNGTLQISQPFAQVNLVSIQAPNQEGSNGVVHIMDGVLKNYWREYTLRDVDQHDELVEGLAPILTRIGFDDPLNEFVPTGTSWIASRNRGYGDDSIALGFFPIVQELQDPENEEFQYAAYLYNLFDFNVYEQDIEPGFQLLVMPRGDLAHMWITKDMEKGVLRFNDAELDRQAFADNGVTQIVKKPLVPPGIAMIMDYCAEYTTINLKDMAQYYKSSEWNLRNLTRSIGTQQGSFNVFAPLQSGYGEFNIEVGVRISTLEWRRHLWDFLLHMTVEPAYTTDELYQLVQENGGYMQLKMLSGFNTTLELDEEGELTVDGARLLRPYDMKGVDGYIHLVEQVPLPPSVLYTVYDQTQQNWAMQTTTRLIDTVQLGVFIDNLLPVTFFSVVDEAWDIIIPTLEIEDVLKNHIFELLWFDDYLADMDGEQITSTNGKQWNVQVFDDPEGIPLEYAPERAPVKIYISNADGPEGLTNCTFMPGPNRTNILSRTGVIHHMDCLLLDFNYSKIDASAPTFAPVQVTVEPMGPTDTGFSNDPTACSADGVTFTCISPNVFMAGDNITYVTNTIQCDLNDQITFDFQDADNCVCQSLFNQSIIDTAEFRIRNCDCAVCPKGSAQTVSLDCSVVPEDPYVLGQCETIDCDGRCNGGPTSAPAFAILTSAPVFTASPISSSPVSSPGTNSDNCLVDDECPDGQFFSKNADGCIELTCENWQVDTPSGCVSQSHIPCQDEFHFCGNDGVCYPYSCEDWYQHGPGEFTGYALNHAVELTCEDYDSGEQDNANAIVYGCRPFQPGIKAPSAVSWVFFFNQECKASYVGREFLCYQNKEGTSYNDFLSEVARINLNECDYETFGFDEPSFWYSIFMEQELPGGEMMAYRPLPLAGEMSFDASKADRTIYSTITGGHNLTSPDPASDECAEQNSVADNCIAENSCEACERVDTFASAQLEIVMVDFFNDIELLMDDLEGVVDRINTFLVDYCEYFKTYACEIKSCCPVCDSEFDKALQCVTDASMREAEKQLADLNDLLEGAALDSEVSFVCDVGELECPMDSNNNATDVDVTVAPEPIPENVTLLQINTTFGVFNTRGLTAKDLLLPENRAILFQALADFVADLVNRIENADADNGQSGRLLRLDSSRRWLEVALHPGSTTIVDIRDVECRSLKETPPENATCQTVFGYYNLQVDDDEDQEVVYETYAQATDEAIQEGKLQESLTAASPDTDVPFAVAGPVERETPAPDTVVPVNTVTVPPANLTTSSQESDSGGVEWWVILVSCLSAVCGCCLFGVAGMFCWTKKQNQDTGNDGDGGESSIKFVSNDENDNHDDDEMTPLEGSPEEGSNDDEKNDDASGIGGEIESHEMGKEGQAQESPLLPAAMEPPRDFQKKQASLDDEEWD